MIGSSFVIFYVHTFVILLQRGVFVGIVFRVFYLVRHLDVLNSLELSDSSALLPQKYVIVLFYFNGYNHQRVKGNLTSVVPEKLFTP